MLIRFRQKLYEAMIQRQRTRLPNLKWLLITCIGLTLAFIFSALILAPSDALDHHFVRERGSVTVLSAVLLTMASAFSIATIVVLSWAKDRQILLWILLAFGLTFFTFDELMQFHERFGRVILNYIDPGIFRNWDDIIVILYGCVALPVMAALLPNLLRHKGVLEAFIVAFAFYGIHTLIDATQEPRTVLSAILEESAKLFSVEFLAIGTFVGFVGVLWQYSPSRGKHNTPY